MWPRRSRVRVSSTTPIDPSVRASPSARTFFISACKTPCVKRICETLPTSRNSPESLSRESSGTVFDEKLPEILRLSARGDLRRRMDESGNTPFWQPHLRSPLGRFRAFENFSLQVFLKQRIMTLRPTLFFARGNANMGCG